MSPIEYRLSGYSEDELKVATDKVADYLRTVPEFFMVRTSFKEPLNGVEFPVASLWEGDRKVPVVLKGTDADSADYATLANEKMYSTPFLECL